MAVAVRRTLLVKREPSGGDVIVTFGLPDGGPMVTVTDCCDV
jgi:hypothetical protein